MILALILILVSLVVSIFLIWKGSDWITDSLIPLAHKLGTSYIAIMTLLVSMLLSLPELFITIYSYFLGYLDIGLGVILGSVIINIGLTVGLSAAVKPLQVEKSIVIRDGIFLIIIAIVVMLFGSDLKYQRSEGLILLLLFIPYVLNVWAFEKWRPQKSKTEKVKRIKENLSLISHIPFLEFKPSVLTFVLGSVMLVFGSYLFSVSLIKLSGVLPIPELFIGIVFGALGTVAPNLAAAIQGTLKGYKDAAVSETFGSNIFTLLVTLGILIILQPFTIVGKLFYFDLTWMIILHLLMVGFIFKGYRYREESLTRFEGMVLVIFYLVIVLVNIFW